jgi:hypothetical protein
MAEVESGEQKKSDTNNEGARKPARKNEKRKKRSVKKTSSTKASRCNKWNHTITFYRQSECSRRAQGILKRRQKHCQISGLFAVLSKDKSLKIFK